jgi:hypothetical protein
MGMPQVHRIIDFCLSSKGEGILEEVFYERVRNLRKSMCETKDFSNLQRAIFYQHKNGNADLYIKI